jgi:hypothetical protein
MVTTTAASSTPENQAAPPLTRLGADHRTALSDLRLAGVRCSSRSCRAEGAAPVMELGAGRRDRLPDRGSGGRWLAAGLRGAGHLAHGCELADLDAAAEFAQRTAGRQFARLLESVGVDHGVAAEDGVGAGVADCLAAEDRVADVLQMGADRLEELVPRAGGGGRPAALTMLTALHTTGAAMARWQFDEVC